MAQVATNHQLSKEVLNNLVLFIETVRKETSLSFEKNEELDKQLAKQIYNEIERL